MVEVSIILPTTRVGGLDVVMSGLQNQTYKNFELILVDGIYNYRNPIIKDKFKEYNFPIIHVAPFDYEFPYNCYCRYANTGLVHASGKLVIFTCDFMYLSHNCVQNHYNNFIENGEKSGLMSTHVYSKVPRLHNEFPHYINSSFDNKIFDNDIEKDFAYIDERNNLELNRYIKDLQEHRLDSVMWSIFKNNYDINKTIFDTSIIDPKLLFPKGQVPYGSFIFRSCYFKNDSCSLDALLSINGWDEDLDYSHGYQDCDLTDRLYTKADIRWNIDPNNMGYLVNVRSIFPYMKMKYSRQDDRNKIIWTNKHNSNYPIVNNWSILETRNKMNNKLKYVSIWVGARTIDDEIYNLIKELEKDYKVSVYGMEGQREGINIHNYEKAMSNKFSTELLITVDEPWAIDFGRAQCKILWIKSDDAVLNNNIFIKSQILKTKAIICNSESIKNNFINLFTTISPKCIILKNNIKKTVEDYYEESLWNPMQPFGSDI